MTGALATLLSFAVCAAVLTITPGADTLLVLTHALQRGRRTALICSLGVNTGLVCWAALTVAGLSALLAASPWAYHCLQLVGALYLLRLGVTGLVRGGAGPFDATRSAVTHTPRSAFRRGVLTNLLNPKVGGFYVSLLPQFAPPDSRGPSLLLELASVHLVLSLAWLGAIGWVAGRASRALSTATTRRLETAGSLALLGAGALVAGSAL
jgi:threonine/homoserine/homoserine lactone efflux protein